MQNRKLFSLCFTVIIIVSNILVFETNIDRKLWQIAAILFAAGYFTIASIEEKNIGK